MRKTNIDCSPAGLKAPPGGRNVKDRASDHELLQAREQVAASLQGYEAPCRRGCWGCCRGAVALWPLEAVRIRPLVSSAALDRLQGQGREANPQESLCPLLDPKTGECSVYEERPLICRAYTTASSTADDCYPERVGIRKVYYVSSPIEVLASYGIERFTLNLREWLWSLRSGGLTSDPSRKEKVR